jgi:hypothetical protein
MPDSLTVTDNIEGQQPAANDTSGSSLQQTRDSESLGVHTALPPASASQDELMAFLRSESSGPQYEANTSKTSVGHTVLLAILVITAIVLGGALLLFYKRLFTRKLSN